MIWLQYFAVQNLQLHTEFTSTTSLALLLGPHTTLSAAYRIGFNPFTPADVSLHTTLTNTSKQPIVYFPLLRM